MNDVARWALPRSGGLWRAELGSGQMSQGGLAAGFALPGLGMG